MATYICVEGLPAVGKSELLAALRLYYPGQVQVFPELVKEVAERADLDPLRDRAALRAALAEALPRRQDEVRAALAGGLTVVEESHLGVHAAYAAALGDAATLAACQRWQEGAQWPDRFLRLETPIAVSMVRQAARGEPRWAVEEGVLADMLAWLSAWHARRGDQVTCIDADRPPEQVVADLAASVGLAYRSLPRAEVLPCVILLGRPAAGKSELIQFLQGLPADERAGRFHVGSLAVVDDFPILWEKFLEDDIWERTGKGRLVSARAQENYYVTDDRVWPFLVEKLNRALEGQPLLPGRTLVVEFARGGAGAYRRALAALSPRALARGGILYLSVSHAESSRRNRSRYDRSRRGGILTHGVPEVEMERTYLADDWQSLAPDDRGQVEVEGQRVPYVTVVNEPEPRTREDFVRRFQPALETLFELWRTTR
ncbi:MAG: hypothetical protein ACP5G2_05925 [Candidatus Bipolaricaulaceae bacterium]